MKVMMDNLRNMDDSVKARLSRRCRSCNSMNSSHFYANTDSQTHEYLGNSKMRDRDVVNVQP